MIKAQLDDLLVKIRENFSLLIAVPPILGGLWQTAQLASMSPIFLRFFSISQLVSDGMLVALILLYAVLIPITIASLISRQIGRIKSPNKKIISLTIGALSITINLLSLKYLRIYPIYIAPIFMFAAFLGPTVVVSGMNEDKRQTTLNFYYITIILNSVMLLLMTIILVNEFSKSTVIIDNLSTTKNKIKTELPKSRIMYFNDKFIFINIDTTKVLKTYRIIKFEKLTE